MPWSNHSLVVHSFFQFLCFWTAHPHGCFTYSFSLFSRAIQNIFWCCRKCYAFSLYSVCCVVSIFVSAEQVFLVKRFQTEVVPLKRSFSLLGVLEQQQKKVPGRNRGRKRVGRYEKYNTVLSCGFYFFFSFLHMLLQFVPGTQLRPVGFTYIRTYTQAEKLRSNFRSLAFLFTNL